VAQTKVFTPAGWSFDCPVAAMLKLGSDGRMGPNDRREFQKRAGAAGAHVFQPYVDRVKFAKDEVPVHLIALGCKEAYGPNRNGDAFSERILQQTHHTFVKHAYWFRNHKNKKADGHPTYGLVKASEYNPQMRRVELLVGLPATKEAAERMGVTYPASEECEKLARGDDIAVSMACRVPYDVCSGCGNKARTRDEYCKEANCKFGGCYENLARLVKTANDVHMLHVDNVSPTFFDISKVWRPADRIAYAGKADWVKAAADGFFGVGGSKTAEDLGVTPPLSVILAQDTMLPGEWTPYLAQQIKLAHGLASLENCLPLYANGELKRAFAYGVQPVMDLDSLGLLADRPEKVAAALGALADEKIVLPLREFARVTGRTAHVKEAGACMKGVFGRMISDGTLESRLANNAYAPASKLAAASHRTAAARIAPAFSLEKSAVDRRCVVSAVRGESMPPSASAEWQGSAAHPSAPAEALARDYACYKVAALRRVADFDPEFMLTARMALCQNQVI